MSLYGVSYDLHNERNYQPVWDQLVAWKAVRLLESLWLLSSALSAVQVRDGLKAKADADDSVIVIELKPRSDWACINARDAGVAWLRQNILA